MVDAFLMFFLPNIALISLFHLTDGADRIFHDSSLVFSPRTSHLTIEESRHSVRERESAHGGRRRR